MPCSVSSCNLPGFCCEQRSLHVGQPTPATVLGLPGLRLLHRVHIQVVGVVEVEIWRGEWGWPVGYERTFVELISGVLEWVGSVVEHSGVKLRIGVCFSVVVQYRVKVPRGCQM